MSISDNMNTSPYASRAYDSSTRLVHEGVDDVEQLRQDMLGSATSAVLAANIRTYLGAIRPSAEQMMSGSNYVNAYVVTERNLTSLLVEVDRHARLEEDNLLRRLATT